MALLMLSGFDLFGPVNGVSANVIALLTQGEWTSATGSPTIVAPLSATGYALNIGAATTVLKTLSGSYARLIGGVGFSSSLSNAGGVQFQDAGSNQVGICINTTGTISIRTGNVASGTVTATSTASVTANTVHKLEWDITFSNAGPATIYLDGIAVIGGTSGVAGNVDTTFTANNSASGIGFSCSTGVNLTFDDFYLLDATGPSPLNAPLLTSPRIETQFPASDGAVQFAVGAAIVGSSVQRAAGNSNWSANMLYLKPITPTGACSLTGVSFLCGATGNASINHRPVVYSSSSGAPGSLLGSGSAVVGMTAGAIKAMPLTTPVSLSAGTQYWIGTLSDIAQNTGLAQQATATDDRWVTSTYASGPPGTAPAMTPIAASVVWGTIVPANSFMAVSNNPAQGAASYVYDATVGHEDLYNFPALSVAPSAIYATAIKASVSKSDAGAKTLSVRQKSGATDSAGSGGTAIAPGTSFAWVTSLYGTDPNGGGAWTKAALDAAQGGVRVES